MLTLTRNNRNMISSFSPTPPLSLSLLFAFISNLKGCDTAAVVVEIVAKVCRVGTAGDLVFGGITLCLGNGSDGI